MDTDLVRETGTEDEEKNKTVIECYNGVIAISCLKTVTDMIIERKTKTQQKR